VSQSHDNHSSPCPPSSRPRRYIFLVTPGGISVHGGMATMARYMLEEWKTSARTPEIRLVNTYGPSLNDIKTMPFYFVAAAISIAANGLLRRIAVLHLHMAEYGSVLRKGLLTFLGKSLGIPVVIHMHSAKFTTMWETASPRRKSAILAVLCQADAIIVLGQFWRQYLVEQLHQPSAKVHIIPNGVPDPGPRPSAPGSDERLNILFAGEVGHRKGVGDLLEAMGSPTLRTHDWHLTIAGSGEIAAHREKARQLGIAGRVSFLGWVNPDQISRLMRTAHIFALPSYQEGLPMAIIEAMANALAVVTTPVGSIPDMIRDGDTGLLVPPGDPAALSAAFLRLLQSFELRAQLGASARQRYLRHLTVSAMCDGLQFVFDGLGAAALPTPASTRPAI
jgi:glycosyltransferase involved in cell wall biosynthesis